MLKITAEEVNFIIYQYLHETGKFPSLRKSSDMDARFRPQFAAIFLNWWLLLIGFQHSSFVFAQEANMHENKYNNYRIPAGLLITFLEKALLLIHMETHLNDVSLPLNRYDLWLPPPLSFS